MVGESIQSYVNLAAGLTRATGDKARTAARGLLAQAGLGDVATEAGDRVSKLAEEILAASRANRELMANLVAVEVDKAADRLGFARSEDLDALRREIAELRLALAHQAARSADAKKGPTKKTAAKKATVTKATGRKATASEAPAKSTAPRKAPAKRAAAARAAAIGADRA